MMKDLFNCSISAEVLQQSNEQCYDMLEQKVEKEIKESIMSGTVMNNDETGIRCEGKTKWIHVSSTHQHTYYALDDKRGKEAMERINSLPHFWGNSVHDRWASYEKYNHCQHSYCNAHLLRDLKAEEENNKSWAVAMKATLLDAYSLSKQEHIAPSAIAAVEKKYDCIVKKAIQQEPLPDISLHKRGRKKQILRFLHDKNIPFDNNLAERDLRMVKLKQKISGCFRTRKGAEIFCRIRSYISTVKKQGGKVWDELKATVKQTSLQTIWVTEGE